MFCFSANCTSCAKSNGVKSGLMVACIIQLGGKMQMARTEVVAHGSVVLLSGNPRGHLRGGFAGRLDAWGGG